MSNQDGDSNDKVGLFLKAMVDREPGKRKVKPSKTALIDLAELDFGESSDDSDFNVDEAKLKEDDDISINSDPDNEDDESSEDDDEEDGNMSVENEYMSVEDVLKKALSKKSIAGEICAKEKILVCAICLGDGSDDTNEIVICDGCHVSVHEGCYGISDTISESSTVSSSSTEPWFCDSCKAGVNDPSCELCPNRGYSIFKETEMGRWVHLVCALYVPGIAFSEVDKLSFPTMFEMSYSRWGSKICSLCEDERYSKTGVCIGCDAGMCRSHFHVTCAQREGLLSEVNQGEADQADPYYAHCKLHSDKEHTRRRKRNWLALQLCMKASEEEMLNERKELQDRMQKKHYKFQDKYQISKASRPTPWFPTQKMSRSLSTSATFFKAMLRKTKLMGVQTESESNAVIGDIRKKWHISPSFNQEFISYYLDRISRLSEMKINLETQIKENETLDNDSSSIRDRYDLLEIESKELKEGGDALLKTYLELHDYLKQFAGRPLKLPPIVASLHAPMINEPYDELKSTPNSKSKKIITKAAAKMVAENTSLEKDSRNVKKQAPLNLKQCHVCEQDKEQHLLIQCDTCCNYYHLSCLDPPLHRMPKKTKQMGWQCSECCKSSDSDKTPDPLAPRKLRRVVKEPHKFSPTAPPQKAKESSEDDASSISVKSPPPKTSAKKAPKRKASQSKKHNKKQKKNTKSKKTMKEQYLATKETDPLSNDPLKLEENDSAESCAKPVQMEIPQEQPKLISPKGRKRKNSAQPKVETENENKESDLPEKKKSKVNNSEDVERDLKAELESNQPTVSLVDCKVLKEDDSSSKEPTELKSEEITPVKRVKDNDSSKTLKERESPRLAKENKVAKEIVKDNDSSKVTRDNPKLFKENKGSKVSKTNKESLKTSKDKTNSKGNDSEFICISENLSEESLSNESNKDKIVEDKITAEKVEESLAEKFLSSKEFNSSLAENFSAASSTYSSHIESGPDEGSPAHYKRSRSKKKKKDKDKERDSESGKKKKKHHRKDKSEMASEIVPPFRLKIKPLPPRPSETSVETKPYTEPAASHTTSTTTAPPGYPPLPPGYTLTQPLQVSVAVTSSASTPVSSSDTSNTSNAQKAFETIMSGSEQFSKCDVCGEIGGVTNTVTCDECQKAYHFNCLEPPLKKSPKRRGYSWFCEDCDNAARP